MNIALAEFGFEEEFPAIPEFEFDRNGHKIETTGITWHLVDEVQQSVTLHWNEFPVGDLKHGFQLWTCHLIRSYATMSVVGIFRAARTTLKYTGRFPASIAELDIDWWRALRQHAREHVGSASGGFKYLRNWYSWLTDRDHPGTDEEIALTIEQWSIDSPARGEAIMARDPDSGPLNARQFAILTQTLLREQPVTIGLAATFLCKELGPNTRNIALLRESHLHVFFDPTDATKKRYQLDIPRIKKRFSRTKAVRRRPLSEPAGKVLEALLLINRDRLGKGHPDMPLFCRGRPLERPGNRFPWQCTCIDIYHAVVQYGESRNLAVHGIRGGGPFRITPRRLRYTYGTRLAAEGATARQIADALDHSNDSTALVYINASLTMVERLFEHMDSRIAPIMDEFMGRMRERSDTDNLIPGRTYNGALLGGLGVCGSGVLCQLMPGFSCYVCRYYEPIADAPHREMLEEAYTIRRRYIENTDSLDENAKLEFLDNVIVGIQGAIAASSKWAEVHSAGVRDATRKRTVETDVFIKVATTTARTS